MAFDSQVAEKNVENAHANFGDVFTGADRAIGQRAQTEQLASPIEELMANRLAGMRNTFEMLQNSPEAHKFADFFEDCRQKAAAGEPAYVLMFSNMASKQA